MFNYSDICGNLIKDLPPRAKDVVVYRFGLEANKKETLEAIGKKYGITRERVRQIQEEGLKKARAEIKKNHSFYQKIFKNFTDYFKKEGSFKKEDKLLQHLGKEKYPNQVFFLLVLGNGFERIKAEQNFYPFWTIEHDSIDLVKKIANTFVKKFERDKKPLSFEEIFEIYKREILPQTRKTLDIQVLLSLLEVSKQISQAPNDQFGLDFWPEINPKGVRDKAYLILKEQKHPLYFKEATRLINETTGFKGAVLPQTVHNELIRDDRFVLVGRGIYALREWGYEPGVIRDVILKILKDFDRPMERKKIIANVLEQRQVKENTIVLNLQNKKYFSRNEAGEYFVKI